MNKIEISLINNDQVVRARTGLNDSQNDMFSTFIETIREELVTGETAILEIEEQDKSFTRFEITQAL